MMDWETSFESYLEHLCEALGHNDRESGLRGLLPRADAANSAQERRAAGGASGTGARERAAPVVASFRGEVGMVRYGAARAGAALGAAAYGPGWRVVLDH